MLNMEESTLGNSTLIAMTEGFNPFSFTERSMLAYWQEFALFPTLFSHSYVTVLITTFEFLIVSNISFCHNCSQ